MHKRLPLTAPAAHCPPLQIALAQSRSIDTGAKQSKISFLQLSNSFLLSNSSSIPFTLFLLHLLLCNRTQVYKNSITVQHSRHAMLVLTVVAATLELRSAFAPTLDSTSLEPHCIFISSVEVIDTALDLPTTGLPLHSAVLHYFDCFHCRLAPLQCRLAVQLRPTAARCRTVAAALLCCSSIGALGSGAATAFELRGLCTGSSRGQEGKKRRRASAKVSFLI